MLKINKKRSLYLSLAVATVILPCCLLGAVFMPRIMETLVRIHYAIHGTPALTGGDVSVLYGMAYGILAITLLADVLLFRLLLRVCREQVFSAPSISCIRYISWCCLLIALLLVCVGVYFRIALCVALLAAFLGLCVRVVKNVIEEATAIKSENDLTV
jgi:hypothetical protein